MTDNAQKIPFGRSANAFAEKKVLDALANSGKALPCSIVSISGWIATVKFEVQGPFTLPNVIVPVASSEYDYLPLRAGDPGVVRAADARLGGLSGLGAGTARFPGAVGNLSALVFEPFGKVSYAAPSNPAFRVVQGPDGVTVQDLDGTAVGTFSKADGITLSFGGNTIVINSSGVAITGTLKINGKAYLDHEHGGVATGSSFSGGVHDP